MTSLCVVSLQKECGFEYASKLQCMFQDTSLSKDLNDSFKSHISATTPLQGKLYINIVRNKPDWHDILIEVHLQHL